MDPLEVHFRYGTIGIDVNFKGGKVIVIDFYGRELMFDSVELNPINNFPSWLYADGVRFCGVKINRAA